MREQTLNHEEMRHEVHEDFEHRGHRGHRVLHGATSRRRRLTGRFAGRPVAPFVSFMIFVSFVVKVSVTSVFKDSGFSAA